MGHESLPEGTYNPATAEDRRVVRYYAAAGDFSPLGPEVILDAAQADQNDWSGLANSNFVISETSEVIYPSPSERARPNALSPGELQARRVEIPDFAAANVRPSARIWFVIHLTYADLLALGVRGLRQISLAAPDRLTLGDRAVETLSQLVERHTGRRLSKDRATTEELVRYYDDIAQASPVLGMPVKNFGSMYDLPSKSMRIGDLLAMSVGEGDHRPSAQLLTFIHDVLIPGIVEPFEAIKRQATR
jgi:hypothetical protein